jgi:hypothetical protein
LFLSRFPIYALALTLSYERNREREKEASLLKQERVPKYPLSFSFYAEAVAAKAAAFLY